MAVTWAIISKMGTPSVPGGNGSTRVYCEVPVGVIDGSNTVFAASHAMDTDPMPILEVNGLVQDPLADPPDFVVSGNSIIYTVAPETGAKHVIWYWSRPAGPGRARQFVGGNGASADSLNWGSKAAFLINGDLSIGMWIQLPSTARGYLIEYGSVNDSSTPNADDSYGLIVAGSSGKWSIVYLHESVGNVSTSFSFPTAIPNDRWTYIGITRDATAKTVSLWIGDGTTVTQVGASQSYTHSPDSLGIGCGLMVGAGYPGYGWNGADHLVGTVEEHYVSSAKWTAADHLAAMQGKPNATGLVLRCQTGNKPEVDTSSTGAVGTLVGTTLVEGH